MIHVQEAKQRMMADAARLPAVVVPLLQAHGRFAWEDVPAPFDHPLFDCSAMDGYAFAFDENATQWTVVGEVAAGGTFQRRLAKGECVRIFTGGMLPEGADTVVMQELAQRHDDSINHTDAKLKKGGNVRLKGEQLRAGEVAVEAGTRLGAAAIGLLASVGVRDVKVAARPRVALLVSGNEFAEGTLPQPGKIFGSNGVMLLSALQALGIQAELAVVPDDRPALIAAWRRLAADHDAILSTGGVSVGDYDLIPATLQELGASIHLHGVMQKPGKPLLYGRLGRCAVFGLPGNPRAVMVLFGEYVAPWLRAVQGAAAPGPETDLLPLAHAVRIKGNRAEFRAARVLHGRVELLPDEGSHMLRSLAGANAIAFIPADQRELAGGQLVEVHYLD
ncbi:MAG: molybdopterin molybdotransferase MoeA [Flavobacteriales bacterium]|nr:molybdopterin molybdotransferase MoeA [Flavobacteriales bacterium]